MPYSVTVIDKKEVEGKYGSFTLLTVDYQGKTSEKSIYPPTLARYPNLKAELDALKPGMVVGLETQLNGKYKEISQIVLEGSQSNATNTSTTKTTHKTPQNYDNVGAQVGNALTNACHSLGDKKVTVTEIETRAWELILLGERLKTRLSNGDHVKENTAPTTDPDAHAGYTEDDVPF